MYAEFTSDLITGNEMIDTQHKKLIGKINDLLISCENDTDKGEAVMLLRYLSDYTNFHFGEEEALQKAIGYPGYGDHVKKHEELRKTVAMLRAILEDEECDFDTFREMVKKEVLDWFLYHINGFDRSVAEFKYMRDNTQLL